MRPSRVFRLIIRMFLLLLTISMSLVSFLGGLSAVLILGVNENGENNILVPAGPISSNLNITVPENMTIEIPYKITNAGYFDLTNLELSIKLKIIYSHWNYTGPNGNETRKLTIFDKLETIDTIIAGDTAENNFTGTGAVGGGFITANIPNPINEINYLQVVNFTIDIILSCSYSLGLLNLRVEIIDRPVDYSLVP